MTETASIPAQRFEAHDTAHAKLMQSLLPAGTGPETRERWWIDFEIQGDLRFISHHDTLRLFRRAFARAAFPIHYTGRFNPHPKLTLPLPRSVGMSSEAEVIVFEVVGALSRTGVLDGLAAQMPNGINLLNARKLEPNEKPQPDSATYRFTPDLVQLSDIKERIEAINCGTSELLIERKTPKLKSARTIDIRQYLVDVALLASDVVFTLRVTSTGTARPSEVVGLIFPDADAVNHRIHRQTVRWR